ncbi:hypothetical protein [Flavobacterium sp.]|uniref:hypothetical protein n=1 Tax=Flavobacterium sp. TaxID=239 RepID=UPI002FDAF6A2
MNFKRVKVYHYFWIVSVIILIIGFFKNDSTENSTLDINVHDTYFVMANLDATLILSIGYFLLGFGYWFVQKKLEKSLIKYLTLIHSIILIGGFITYWLVVGYNKLFAEKPFPLFDSYQVINQTLLILFLLIITIAQPIYFINLSGFSEKKRLLLTAIYNNHVGLLDTF